LMSQIAHEEKLRLWSAGCSNGQEPYTVAAVVEKFFASRRPVDYRITATDIDLKVLARAEQGEYRGADVNGLSMQQGSALFGKAWAAAEELRVKQPLRESVEFNRLNLVERWPFREPFDVIFCRNVVIYFERRLQAELWGRFYELLRPGGYLFIGHSERLSGPADAQFEKVGITTFQKPMTA